MRRLFRRQSQENIFEDFDMVRISELPDSDAGVVPDTFAMRFSRV